MGGRSTGNEASEAGLYAFCVRVQGLGPGFSVSLGSWVSGAGTLRKLWAFGVRGFKVSCQEQTRKTQDFGNLEPHNHTQTLHPLKSLSPVP